MRDLEAALKSMIDQYHAARLDGKACSCLTCREIVQRAENTLKEALESDHGTIMGYQAFAGLVLALGVFALSHGAFALAISFFAGWR